jgi:hypothetical protein
MFPETAFHKAVLRGYGELELMGCGRQRGDLGG